MNAEAIRDMLNMRPFETVEAELSSGQVFTITRPENVIVTKSTLVVADPETDTVQWTSLVNVVAVRRRHACLPSASKGEIVSINNKVGVIVLTGKQLGGDLEDHVGVWFGNSADGVPEVWTVPTECLTPGPRPALKH